MTPYLTVKEASRLTGKSPSSIRRVIYPIIHDEGHPDRCHVQPTVEEVMNLRVQGENFAWRVSEELLRREIPADTRHERPVDTPTGKLPPHPQSELIAMLRRELDIKNQQIAQYTELLKGLNERIHEGNVLIGSLQQRLALNGGRSPAPEDTKAKPVNSNSPKKASTMPAKPAKPKRGILARIFRP